MASILALNGCPGSVDHYKNFNNFAKGVSIFQKKRLKLFFEFKLTLDIAALL